MFSLFQTCRRRVLGWLLANPTAAGKMMEDSITTITACHPAQGDNNNNSNNAGAAAAGSSTAALTAARINPEMAARRWTSLNLTRSDGGPKGLGP